MRKAQDALAKAQEEAKSVEAEKQSAEKAAVDARSALLNLGLEKAQGRYLAFLDYDDVLYPEAYELMVSKLIQSGAAAAFASVRILRLDVYDRFFYATQEVTPPYRGESLLDLFRNNFCPLHSYVIDRNQIPSDLLRFDTSLVMEEDYDLLLRISASLPTDFSLLGTQIGDYYYKTDDSNTVPTNGGLTGESRDRYEEVRSAIELRRRSTPVAIAVQRSLGITETSKSMTIRDVIDRIKGRH